MEKNMGIALILVVSAAVLLIGVLGRKAAYLLRFLTRMVIGGIAIHLTNSVLASLGIAWSVGLNLISLFLVGSLGMGGFGMLYAILLYINL